MTLTILNEPLSATTNVEVRMSFTLSTGYTIYDAIVTSTVDEPGRSKGQELYRTREDPKPQAVLGMAKRFVTTSVGENWFREVKIPKEHTNG
jgi:hypothetical protein